MNMMRKNRPNNNNRNKRQGGYNNNRRNNNRRYGNQPRGAKLFEGKTRQQALQMREKFQNMARDAQISGDRVQYEYYLQHVDHYTRIVDYFEAVEAEEAREREALRAEQEGDENFDEAADDTSDDANDDEEPADDHSRRHQQSSYRSHMANPAPRQAQHADDEADTDDAPSAFSLPLPPPINLGNDGDLDAAAKVNKPRATRAQRRSKQATGADDSASE